MGLELGHCMLLTDCTDFTDQPDLLSLIRVIRAIREQIDACSLQGVRRLVKLYTIAHHVCNPARCGTRGPYCAASSGAMSGLT